MNEVIERIIESIKTSAEKWHADGKEIFDLDRTEDGSPEYYAVKLLHHNYLIWHYIDLYKSPDSNTVLFVYDKGIEHNKYRNETIEKLDEILCKLQQGSGKINTETIGSAIDRLSIHYIKYLHLKTAKDSRYLKVLQQFYILVGCVNELMEDMIAGNRQCLVFSRFKIDYSEK